MSMKKRNAFASTMPFASLTVLNLHQSLTLKENLISSLIFQYHMQYITQWLASHRDVEEINQFNQNEQHLNLLTANPNSRFILSMLEEAGEIMVRHAGGVSAEFHESAVFQCIDENISRYLTFPW